MVTLAMTCAQTHTHISGRFFIAHLWALFIALPVALPLHTHTRSCVLEICLLMTHAYMHPYPCSRLIACTNTYFFTFTGAFPLHACGVTRNWCTYFTSVWRVFLVEAVVLQTVLWDIRAWSARFVVFVSTPIVIIHGAWRFVVLWLLH